jgi:inhibitor of KinA sporulation pathway (predicted exonuclease)
LSSSPESLAGPPAGDVLVVFDLEYTAWEGSLERGWSAPGEHREIVQVGAVRLDTLAGWKEVASLSRLVRPRVNPRLSAYLIALTGITQERVDVEGVDLAEALAELIAFGVGAVFCSNGPDGEVIAENCRLRQVPLTLGPERFIDVRPYLARRLCRPSDEIDSYRLAREFCGTGAGRAHDALADARGVAAALRQIVQPISHKPRVSH